MQKLRPQSGTPCMQVAGAAELQHAFTAHHDRMQSSRQDLAAGMPTSTVSTCSSASARVMASRCRTTCRFQHDPTHSKTLQLRLIIYLASKTEIVAPCINIMSVALRC